jgi:hypothetical protein
LKGVLDILFMVQDLPADAPNQFAMAPDQSSEGSFVLVGKETLEELGIIQFVNACDTNQLADVLDDTTKLRRHLLLPGNASFVWHPVFALLTPFRPYPHVAIIINLDVDDVEIVVPIDLSAGSGQEYVEDPNGALNPRSVSPGSPSLQAPQPAAHADRPESRSVHP